MVRGRRGQRVHSGVRTWLLVCCVVADQVNMHGSPLRPGQIYYIDYEGGTMRELLLVVKVMIMIPMIVLAVCIAPITITLRMTWGASAQFLEWLGDI